MIALFKRCFKRALPAVSAEITGRRNRRFFERRHGMTRRACAVSLYGKRTPAVLSGPFYGMAYINDTTWGPITPKWLGGYELELWPAIEEAITRKYAAFIDVGCAEGYCAVGLARVMPGTPVFAYDTDPGARRQCRALAKINKMVSRIEIRRWFVPSELVKMPSGRKLLIVDIEGYEMLLLNSEVASAYVTCDILVEIHHFSGHDIAEVERSVRAAFAVTHEIRTYYQRPRVVADVPVAAMRSLGEARALEAMDEGRQDNQRWLWMTTKHGD